MGLDDCSPALHSLGRLRCASLRQQAGKRSTAAGVGVRQDAARCADTDDLPGEPGKHHIVKDSQAGSDNSAVAIWAWGNQGYLPMAEGTTEANADKRRLRSR